MLRICTGWDVSNGRIAGYPVVALVYVLAYITHIQREVQGSRFGISRLTNSVP